MEVIFSRFGIALLAVFSTGLIIAAWHLWLERAGLAPRLLVLALYFGFLAFVVRTMRRLSGIE